MPAENDKEVDEVIGDNQAPAAKSEESELKLEDVAQIARATQKGYTVTRQELSQVKDMVQQILDNSKTKEEDPAASPYVTEQRLKEIFLEVQGQQEQAKQQANSYIENTLEALRVDGTIAPGDEEPLMQFALRIKEPNLERAAEVWKEVKNEKDQVKNEVAKKQERQQVGSKVGTSSRADGGTEKKGIDYTEIRKMRDWYGN
jgi:hypothetical protein